MNQGIDFFQRYIPNRTAALSTVEIAVDRAAREIADALDDAMDERLYEQRFHRNTCIDLTGMDKDLKKLLEGILCVQ